MVIGHALRLAMGWEEREHEVAKQQEELHKQKQKPVLSLDNVHLAISHKLKAATSGRVAKVVPSEANYYAAPDAVDAETDAMGDGTSPLPAHHGHEHVHHDWDHVTVGGIVLFLYLELAQVG